MTYLFPIWLILSGLGDALLAAFRAIVALFGVTLPVLAFSGCLCLCLMSTGCQLFKPNTEPIERGMTKIMSEVVKPAVAKASEELSARTAQLQGQGSLINPGYKVTGHAGMFNGVMYDFTITTVGVSANLAAVAQADAGQPGTVLPPVNRLNSGG